MKVTAPDTKMGGTQVWLKEKEEFPVEELIYAMMIQSANDAAYALARTAAGSVDALVAEMNAKAHELGMASSIFRTPHGLPPANRRIDEGDLTTPRDYALLFNLETGGPDAERIAAMSSGKIDAGIFNSSTLPIAKRMGLVELVKIPDLKVEVQGNGMATTRAPRGSRRGPFTSPSNFTAAASGFAWAPTRRSVTCCGALQLFSDQEQAVGEIGERAKEQGIALVRTPSGFGFAPRHGDGVMSQIGRAHV